MELLSKEKKEIAARFQNRHEGIVSQMQEDLKRDAEKERAEAEVTRCFCIYKNSNFDFNY